MMMYGETFYGHHTAQLQLQQCKIKVKKDLTYNATTL